MPAVGHMTLQPGSSRLNPVTTSHTLPCMHVARIYSTAGLRHSNSKKQAVEAWPSLAPQAQKVQLLCKAAAAAAAVPASTAGGLAPLLLSLGALFGGLALVIFLIAAIPVLLVCFTL